jgi:hypothetical protein
VIHVKYPTIAVLVIGIALGTTILPVYSQGVKVQKDALQKTQWYKAPIEIQILDDGSGGRGALGPNTLNGLPKSGFESNFRPSVVAPQQALPSGSSTNIMINRMQANRSAAARMRTQPSPSTQTSLRKLRPTTTSVATYDTYSRGSLLGKGSAPQVKTSVQAEVRRGSLLSK